jgi:hypothetical protein
MLPVAVLPLFLEFFDGIDAVVVRKLMRRVPFDETAITQILCDLLDEDYSDETPRSYPLAQLRVDVSAAMPLARLDFTVDTHQYSPQMERWVTQSDIGMTLRYEDHFTPTDSWTRSLLLQAKRLFPVGPGPEYNEVSKFDSVNPVQHKRIIALNEVLRCDLVKYLLYCPRPSSLDGLTEAKLAHLRNKAVTGSIFDYMRGLALHRELQSGGKTLAAGIFVAKADGLPSTLGATHRKIFKETVPLSWLLALEFADVGQSEDWWPEAPFGVDHGFLDEESKRIVQGIVQGDESVTQEIGVLAGRNADLPPLRVLPRHTINITVSAGGLGDPDRRLILSQ